MTMLPDNPERDPALSKAWREHSDEMPPSHLDAAIRAAARRAVGGVPREMSAPEATSPQRWWMPLAAAATIGAVALGVLQTMPPDQPVTSSSVSDMPAAPSAPPVSALEPAARDKLTTIERKDKTQANADSVTAPLGAAHEQDAASAPPAAAPVARRKQAESAPPPSAAPVAPAAQAESAPLPSAAPRVIEETPAQVTAPANAPMKPGPKIDAQRAAGNAGAPALAMDAAPQPFPAETKRETDAGFAKGRGDSVPGVGSVASAPPVLASKPNVAPVAAVPTPPAAEFQGRPDADAASRSQVAPAPRSPPAFAATAPESARLAPPRDEARQRNELAPSTPSATGGVALAKKSAGAEKDNEMRDAGTRASMVKDSGKAVDVDEWIARIRKLHDDGKLADAAKELNLLRAAVRDADSRLPPDLHAWAATVKR